MVFVQAQWFGFRLSVTIESVKSQASLRVCTLSKATPIQDLVTGAREVFVLKIDWALSIDGNFGSTLVFKSPGLKLSLAPSIQVSQVK